MFDSSLLSFMNNLKIEIISISEKYLSQLMNEQIKFNRVEDITKVFEFIEKNKTIILTEEFKSDFFHKKDNLELNKTIDLFIIILKLENNPNLSQFEFKLIRTILSEIKIFRNLFSHSDNVTDELIQRFFENTYFLFKYIQLPKNKSDLYNEDKNFLNEITYNIQNSLIVNLKNSKSFNFDYSLVNSILKKDEKKIELPKFEEINNYCIEFQKEINDLFKTKIKQNICYFNPDNIKYDSEQKFKFFNIRDEYLNDFDKDNNSMSNTSNSFKKNSNNSRSLSNEKKLQISYPSKSLSSSIEENNRKKEYSSEFINSSFSNSKRKSNNSYDTE